MNARAKTIALALGVALSLTLAGCKETDTGLRFSHALHAGETGCPDCHRGDTLRTGMEPCRDCHDIDEGNPSAACLVCHTRPGDADYTVDPTARGRSYADVLFDHGPHDGAECAACHRAADKADGLSDMPFPAMEVCLGCHEGAGVATGCSECHRTLRADQPPPGHDGAWARRHGGRTDLEKRVCGFCHEGRNPCEACHRQDKPRSHTIEWKGRSHGFEAAHDRDNCRACHTATFCSDCHATPPRSHAPRNGWLASGHRVRGAVALDSCLVCHRRGEASCLVCHPGGF